MRIDIGTLTAGGALMLATTVNAATAAPRNAVLHAASYDGKITTLSLKSTGKDAFELTVVPPPTTDAGPNPSWLILQNGSLYSIDEAMAAKEGLLTEYTDDPQGNLTLSKSLKTLVGGVHGAFYAGGKALAVAHYGTPGAVTTYRIDKDIQPFPPITFPFSGPGPNPDRQEAPHPHQIIVDPTGEYILVPDLGSDLVHVFYINQLTLQLDERDPLQAGKGSGPRHGVFGKGGSYFYLVGELENTVTVYKSTVLPGGAGITFEQVQKTDTFAGAFEKDMKPIPKGAAAAEIALTPCGGYIAISNRFDNRFSTANSSADSLATYSVNPANGMLSPIDVFSATGPTPRQFAFNRRGDLAAVGLQGSGNVSIIMFDRSTGRFGKTVASVKVGEAVVCVVWDPITRGY